MTPASLKGFVPRMVARERRPRSARRVQLSSSRASNSSDLRRPIFLSTRCGVCPKLLGADFDLARHPLLAGLASRRDADLSKHESHHVAPRPASGGAEEVRG